MPKRQQIRRREDFVPRRKTSRGSAAIKAANGEIVEVSKYMTRERPKWAEELDDREWRYVEEYCVDLHQKHAAQRAGIGGTRHSSATMASQMMRRPHVARAIDAAIASTCGGAVRTRIIDELAAIGFHDPDDYMTFNGNTAIFKDGTKLTKAQMKAVKRIKQVRGKNPSMEIELYDKIPALSLLGRAVGLGKEGNGGGVSVTVNIIGDDKGLL